MKQFLTGLLCGAVGALLVAAGGALYVTESPIPFMSKIQSSSTDFVKEALKDRSSDPNEKLYAPGTTPREPSAPAAAASPGASSPAAAAQAEIPAEKKSEKTAPQAETADAQTAAPGAVPAAAPVQPQNPNFFVHVGAYKTPDEAETIRAKIAFSGLDSDVSRGNDGYFRVRVGPFKTEAAARKTLDTLRANDIPGQVIH